MKRTWKKRIVRLQGATVVIFDGPGTDWVCLMRGTRAASQPDATRGHARGGQRPRERRA